jgi:hypothetical protein
MATPASGISTPRHATIVLTTEALIEAPAAITFADLSFVRKPTLSALIAIVFAASSLAEVMIIASASTASTPEMLIAMHE